MCDKKFSQKVKCIITILAFCLIAVVRHPSMYGIQFTCIPTPPGVQVKCE